MKLEGEYRFALPRQRLWEALLDATLLERVLPGCEPLERVGEDASAPAWRAALTVAIGPVKGRFQGTLGLSDLVAPTSYRMRLDGSGPAGFLRGEGSISLREEGPSATTLLYAMDAQVGGRLAAVGQRLVESSGRAMAKQGLEGLERELSSREASAAGAALAREIAGASDSLGGSSAASSTLPAPPSQAVFAARFARGLWGELPASWRWGILALAATVVGAIAWLALR